MAPVVFAVALCVKVVPFTVSADNAVVPPIAPDKVTVLLALNVKLCAPLIVLEKERAEPVSTTVAVKPTAPVIVMGLAVVVSDPPKLIAPV